MLLLWSSASNMSHAARAIRACVATSLTYGIDTPLITCVSGWSRPSMRTKQIVCSMPCRTCGASERERWMSCVKIGIRDAARIVVVAEKLHTRQGSMYKCQPHEARLRDAGLIKGKHGLRTVLVRCMERACECTPLHLDHRFDVVVDALECMDMGLLVVPFAYRSSLCLSQSGQARGTRAPRTRCARSVSYTHLTLPTSDLV